MSLAKAIARSVAVSGLALVLMGCPYESPEPLTPLAAAVLDARLDGAWRCVTSSDDEATRVTFTPFDEHQYVLTGQGGADKDELGLMRGQAGKLREASFLSVQELEASKDGKPPGWSWIRYSIVDGDLLRLRFLDDKLLKEAKTPAEARASVEKHLDSPELYEDGMVCVRVAEPEPKS